MIDFKPLTLADRERCNQYLADGRERGCEYTFANLYLWGRQQVAFCHDQMLLFSQFNRKSVYPCPVGPGDRRLAVDAIIRDAHRRGIPCRITCLQQQDVEFLEQNYPGQFRIHCDRDSYDYVYAINDLADLKGRSYQRKRNHCNKFYQSFPGYRLVPLGEADPAVVQAMVEAWYTARRREDPYGDYHMEQAALLRALRDWRALGMDGLVLTHGSKVLAVTLASILGPETADVHFEKALPEADGAYTVINREFARYLREKYPRLRYLNREDDMGIEGLRKAKLSYYPHHMVEKCWACLLEDGYAY